MRVLLEWFRIVLVFLFLGAVGFLLLEQLYHSIPTTMDWIGIIGVFLLIFLLYRNKLQFTGWYQGKKRTSFNKKTSLFISLLAIVCIISPFFAGSVV